MIALAIAGMAAAQVEVSSASSDPAEVEAGETVDEQAFIMELQGLSTDGEVDYVNLSFSEQFSEDDLSINSVDSNVSIEEDAELVEGDNGQMITLGLNPEEDEETNAEVTFDMSVTYPEDFESMTVDINIEDSQEESASEALTVETGEMQNETEEPGTNETENETFQNDTEEPGLDPENETDDPNVTEPGQPENETGTDENGDGLIDSFISWLRDLF